MCLNNWHYINEKVISFHEEINFFTGHSGSGKSTVLDALQIILYADSNGRGFFNKAAKEDSDRTLIEYLRGMKVVQENNDISYLRNKNFSTTIVLEFLDTETKKYQSIGVIFDVDVSINDVNRMFFWHAGELAPNCYRDGERVLSISELRDYIQENYVKEEYYFSRTNEKFRNELYSNYFGGLHPKHFPALFKKAIPFKMDMKLEDFVKNYICTENDIHMEDMQDSVAQYTRLKRRLEDTKNEIHLLEEIKAQYGVYQDTNSLIQLFQYRMDHLDIQSIQGKLDKSQLQQSQYQEDVNLIGKAIESLEEELNQLQAQRDEVVISIQNSGYEHLEAEVNSLNQMQELLNRSKASYDQTAKALGNWLKRDILDPSLEADIVNFQQYEASPLEIERLKLELSEIKKSVEEDKSNLNSRIHEMNKSISEVAKQVTLLKSGQKVYPSYLLEAKDYIEQELELIYETPVQVDILADVVEVNSDKWLNAVEGYMGNNKLNLIVDPRYVKTAMEIYQKLDSMKYYKVAIIDTERVLMDSRPALKNSLAEVVEASSDYTKAYIEYLMGAVIRCNSIDELCTHRSSITAECILYQGYKIQHINPRGYTEEAFIGRSAVERRLKQLELTYLELQDQRKPIELQLQKTNELLSLEYLPNNIDYYQKLQKEIKEILQKEDLKNEYVKRIRELKEKNIDDWKAQKFLLEQSIHSKTSQINKFSGDLRVKESAIREFQESILQLNEDLINKQKIFVFDQRLEDDYQSYIKGQENKKTEQIWWDLQKKKQDSETKSAYEYEKLVKRREQYHSAYAYRGFSLTNRDNREYDQLLENLSSDKLNDFTKKANEQAVKAIHHFKSDFIYKIRDAIKEVMQQKDDLNRILSQLDFGKDKYKFIITKNRGEDGKFYDMFMDENLEINPHQLTDNISNQMDMFSLQHEKDHSDLINELIELFMPPNSSDPKALEEARINMEKYSDYRTYLSFDMEQLVEGMPPMRLSRMLSKNSGGEGQNPLYVALLASFAQVYRINLKANNRRRPTPRLVVLDEAFSKMDAEKVGSCIGLIRKLGFQAIISATNDKIQNYVDNVDKTFVFANPNKNRISVQEFEKREFKDLLTAQEDEKDDTY
jgi:uncharacterized protein YPO0396